MSDVRGKQTIDKYILWSIVSVRWVAKYGNIEISVPTLFATVLYASVHIFHDAENDISQSRKSRTVFDSPRESTIVRI